MKHYVIEKNGEVIEIRKDDVDEYVSNTRFLIVSINMDGMCIYRDGDFVELCSEEVKALRRILLGLV